MAINVITAARIEAKTNEVNKIIGDAILNEYLYRLSQKQMDEFESLIQDADDYCRQLGGIFELEEEVGSRFAQLKKQANETHQELRKWYFKHSPGAKRGHEHDLFEFNKDVMGSLRNWFWLNIRSPEEGLNEAVETEPQANLFRFFVEGYDCRLWTFRLFPDGLFRTGSWVLDLIGMVSPSCPYTAKTDLNELGDCFEFSTLLFDHVDDSGLTHYFSQLALRYAGSKCHAIYHVVKGPESDVVSGRPPSAYVERIPPVSE